MKKRLLIYSDCFTFSGSENVILNVLSSGALNQDYEIIFLYRHSKRYSEKMTKAFEKNKIYVAQAVHLKRFSDIYFNSNWPLFLRKMFYKIDQGLDFLLIYQLCWLPFFVKKIGAIKPQIVHINNGGYPAASSCLTFAIAARICKVSKIIMHVNNLAAPLKWYAITHKFLDYLIKKSVTNFVTGSKAAAAALSARRKFDRKSIFAINNTLLHDFKEKDFNEISIKKQPNEIWVGYVGLLTERKGVNVLIEAAKILKNDLQSARAKIVIVGDGEEELVLKQTVNKYKLEELILFTGYTADVRTYIEVFEIFVLPSVANEDFPYVLLEAMALAKPIVSTKIAGIPEIVEEGQTGFVTKPGSAVELADKIKSLLFDKDLRRKMGKKGEDRYNTLFSYDKTIKKLAFLYSH